MSFQGFGLGDVKLRTANGDWLGTGNHELRVELVKDKGGDIIAEFEVLSTRDKSDRFKTRHQVGDKVSVKFSTAGSGWQTETARQEYKMLLAAIAKSCGREPMSIASGQWDTLHANVLDGKAKGVVVRAGGWHKTKDDGSLATFTSIDWSGVAGGTDIPALFQGFGFGGGATDKPKPAAPATATAAPAARPGARPAPAVDPAKRAEVLEGLREWQAAGVARDEVADASGEYGAWGVGLVGAIAYSALVAEVYGA